MHLNFCEITRKRVCHRKTNYTLGSTAAIRHLMCIHECTEGLRRIYEATLYHTNIKALEHLHVSRKIRMLRQRVVDSKPSRELAKSLHATYTKDRH